MVSKICALIPTYNNGHTLGAVINDILRHIPSVVVVNDGATDDTATVLAQFEGRIMLVSYPQNRGKGYALKQGFAYAAAHGFEYAITLDSDGQHFSGDIPAFIEMAAKHPQTLIVGSRNLRQNNMPKKNTFANRFSNFWFTVQTAYRLPDTQTGYRMYPLLRMGNIRLFTTRYETELEILVRSAWRGIPIIAIPVRVHYATEGKRVSHFRPVADFGRISLLNTLFTLLAVVYGYPSMLIRKILQKDANND